MGCAYTVAISRAGEASYTHLVTTKPDVQARLTWMSTWRRGDGWALISWTEEEDGRTDIERQHTITPRSLLI